MAATSLLSEPGQDQGHPCEQDSLERGAGGGWGCQGNITLPNQTGQLWESPHHVSHPWKTF